MFNSIRLSINFLRTLLCGIFCCITYVGFSQDLSSLRQADYALVADTLLLDTLSIVPHSVSIQGVDTSKYHVAWDKAILYWHQKPQQDSLHISYRVFPFSLSKSYFHKDARLIETNLSLRPFEYDALQANQNAPFIDFGDINYSGSFGRALSFGNSQDVVLNSQFNLQLEGNLGDSIQLTGSITDNTIPFQPEGNTQQLQEFDKIFIQLKRKQTSLIAGDYDIQRPKSYFMNFYKRVQGGMVSGSYHVGKKDRQRTAVAASLAKGKFVRNKLIALEGNQGPYKLTGPNGEQYFVVLAGTEKVFIDGIPMTRGEDQDYIIDYNTAEISFMPRRIITKDLRIVVEFEFSDRNYLNSLIYVHHDWQMSKKMEWRLDVFSNQDAKNQAIQQNLDTSQKRYLAGIGDSIHLAFYPSVRYQDTFKSGKILYKKIDTTVNSILYNTIYLYSTNPDSAKYELNFTYVGLGNGNYIQSINNANGRVYAWQAPQNGQRIGDYEPVIILVTPKKQQLVTLGNTYHIDSNKILNTEVAVSQYDPNTFSSKDNETHTGLAARLNYDEKRWLTKSHKIQLQSNVNYEFVQDRFKPIERFRTLEFARDWNIDPSLRTEHEHLGNIALNVLFQNSANAGYKFGTYLRGNTFRGTQQSLFVNFQKNGYSLSLRNDLMQQRATVYKSTFYKPSLQIEHQWKKLQQIILGSKFILEHNALRSLQTDTLLKSAFSFDATTFYLKTNPASTNILTADYTLRHDRAAARNEFKQSTRGHTFSLGAAINSIEGQQIRGSAAYRILTINDTTLTALKPEESLVGRIEYDFNFIKGLISGNLLYEFGAGQELKREYAYVEVPIGQGLYVWRDYNQDGVQQLNEFELAIFPDEKKFIKILTPTNQYVKAKYSVYNQTISINPKAILPSTRLKGIKKIISILYLQSAIQLNNRFIGREGISQYNPFLKVLDDSLLINNSSAWMNSIILNRFSNQWGLDYVHTTNASKTLLNYGIDGRRNREHLVRARYNLTQQFTLGLSGKLGKKVFVSQFLESRSFEIHSKTIEPGITYLFMKNQFRIQSNYKYDIRENALELGGEKATIQSLLLDVKYNIVSSGSINLRSTYSSIQFNGNANSGLGYTILDGFQKGSNWLWQAGFEKRISKSIEMSLEYEGRKPANSPAVHTGRASIRAIF